MALGLVDSRGTLPPSNNSVWIKIDDTGRPYLSSEGRLVFQTTAAPASSPAPAAAGRGFQLPSLDTRQAMQWLRDNRTAVYLASGALFVLALVRSRR